MDSTDSSEDDKMAFKNTSSLEIISSAKLGGEEKKEKDVVLLHSAVKDENPVEEIKKNKEKKDKENSLNNKDWN